MSSFPTHTHTHTALPSCNLQVKEELMSLTYDIVITTYEVIMIEKAALRKFHWKCVPRHTPCPTRRALAPTCSCDGAASVC